MASEWVLNQLLNRFQLNRKKRVGAVVEMIHDVRPTSLAEWEQAYKERALDDTELDALGDELFEKRGVLEAEIAAMTRGACRDYVRDVIFRRTWEGYMAERDLVSVELERMLQVSITHAPDEWDRGYGVDLIVGVTGRPMGVQVKPASFANGADSYGREAQLRAAHDRFLADMNGTVTTIVYDKSARRIENSEVIAALQIEVERRRNEAR
jgi:hypothetical protein